MARTCKCCTHPKRAELDRELVANHRPYRSIAQDFAVSPDSVFRHQRDHLPKLLVQAAEAMEVAQADDLIAELKQLNAKARELAAKAENAGDYRTALMAVRELTRLLELTAKLTGELDERAQHNELHMHLPPDRALAVAKTYLERHAVAAPVLPVLPVPKHIGIVEVLPEEQHADQTREAVPTGTAEQKT